MPPNHEPPLIRDVACCAVSTLSILYCTVGKDGLLTGLSCAAFAVACCTAIGAATHVPPGAPAAGASGAASSPTPRQQRRSPQLPSVPRILRSAGSAAISAASQLETHAAAAERRHELLERRREFNQTKANYRRFWEAVKEGDAVIVRTLLEQGADPDMAVTPRGQTPLGIAAMNGHATDRCDVVAALLSPPLDDDISVDNLSGNMTPLQIAALRGKSGILRQLLLAGADYTATDRDGETALDNARRFKHKECIAVLEAWAAGTRDAGAIDVVAKKARPWFDRLGL